MMRERGFRVVGLDFSREAAAIAWRRQQAPAVCGDLAHAPLRAGSFAGITMFHVLEHLHDPRAYLAAARELLAPDGRLVVQVPNAASWQFRLLGRRWNGVDVPRHLFDFRDRDVERLLEACGFEVVRRKYFSLRDNPAGLATQRGAGARPHGAARAAGGGKRRRAAGQGPGVLGAGGGGAAVTLAEAAFRAGSTVMIEARKR